VANPIRRGNQARTSGGSAGCIIETPAAMMIVVAKSIAAFGNAARAVEPMALMRRPITSAGTMPKRAMKTAPGMATSANNIGARLESQPTSVSDRLRSA